MATDMTDEPDFPAGDEDTPSTTTQTDFQTLCAKQFTDYRDGSLSEDRESASGDAAVACLGYEEYQNKVRLRLCRLEDARAVNGEYRALRNIVSTTMAAHAKGLSVNAAAYEKTNEALTKKLEAGLKSLKAVKDQMGKVRDVACKLETKATASCTNDERAVINKTLGDGVFKRGAREIVSLVKGETDQGGEVTTKGIIHHTDDLFDMGVKYAGIQASSNVESLKSMADKLTEIADGIAKDVLGQTTALEATILTHQTELDKEIAQLSEGLYLRHDTQVYVAGLDALTDHLTDIIGGECGTMSYDQALQQLKENCGQVVTTFDTTAICPPEGGDDKFNTQSGPSC